MTAKMESRAKAEELRQALMNEAARRMDEDPVILIKLAALLLARDGQPNPLGEAMLSPGEVSEPEATEPSMKALSSALLNDVTYIIGTPEQGRPVVSDLAYELHRSGRSVLVVSEGKDAVNAELSGIAENLEGTLEEGEPFPVFRLGNLERGMDRRMALKNQQQQVGRELYRRQEEVLQERKGLQAKINAIQEKVNARLALRETPLAKLQEEVHELDSLESEAFNYTAEKERKSGEVASIKRQYPRWEDGAVLERQIHKLEREAGRLDHMENGIREKERELEETKAELERHHSRDALQEKRSAFPDTDEQNAVIIALTSKIAGLKDDRKGFSERREKFQEIVQEFEAKSSLVKLFSSKKALEDAQESLSKCDEAIDALNRDIETEQQNLTAAEEQLASCEALDKEIEEIQTENTPEYCEQRIEFLQNTLETRKRDIPQMERRRAELAQEKADLETKMAEGATPYNRIQELESQIAEAEEKAEKAAAAAVKKARSIGPKLLKELEKLGESTALLENDSAQAVYHKLVQIHRTMSDELASLDVTGCRMKIASLNKSVATTDQALEDIESRFSRMDAQTVLDACIIGTTIEEMLAENKQAEALETRKFDTVIIDEAARLPIPAIWALAYLASKSLVLVGDVRDSLAPAASESGDVEVVRLDAFDETLEEAEGEEAVAEAPAELAEVAATETEPAATEEAVTTEELAADEEVVAAEESAEAEEAAATETKPAAEATAAIAVESPQTPKPPRVAPAKKLDPPVLRAGSITESQRQERARLVAELFGEDLVPESRAQERRMERLEERGMLEPAVKETEPLVKPVIPAEPEPAAEPPAVEHEPVTEDDLFKELAPAAPVEPEEPEAPAEQEVQAEPESTAEQEVTVEPEVPTAPAEPEEAEAPAEPEPIVPEMTRVVEPPKLEDFQTSSVKESDGIDWMRTDIFEYSGMRKLYELGEEAGNLIVLDE